MSGVGAGVVRRCSAYTCGFHACSSHHIFQPSGRRNSGQLAVKEVTQKSHILFLPTSHCSEFNFAAIPENVVSNWAVVHN